MIRPAFYHTTLGLLALGLAISLIGPPRAPASTIVVPDEAPTIQAALNARVDTVLVRPGDYAETATVARRVALMGLSDEPAGRPSVKGLTLRPENWGPFVVRDLRVEGLVFLADGGVSEFYFTRCDLPGGVNDNIKNYNIWFSQCSIAGPLDLWADYASLDSCQVTGNVTNDKSHLTVRGCTIQGGGVRSGGDGGCVVENSVIRGGWHGIWSYGDGLSASNNVIEDCQGAAVVVDGNSATITNNVIRNCGAGIDVPVSGGVSIVGNSIMNIGGTGLAVGEGDAEIIGNVVARCGANGVVIGYAYRTGSRVRNNTSCFNGASGFVSAPYQQEEQVWTGNIAYRNGSYGISSPELGAVVFSCNDWFGNQAGDVQGMTFPSADVSTEPQFCDAVGGDFQLNSASPLLDWPGCGQVGALGVGCGATPTLVQRFTAGRVAGGVSVVWQVAAGATASSIWVERAEGADGQAWTRPVMERSSDGGSVVELDRSALPDHTYRYRLVAMDGGELFVLDPGILVEGQVRLSFALGQVGPSPGDGQLRIAFTLAHSAAIRIDVFDLLGRRVATPAQGMWPAGTQVVGWDGLTHAGRTAPAGMYVIHYRYPGGTDKRPVVRVP